MKVKIQHTSRLGEDPVEWAVIELLSQHPCPVVEKAVGDTKENDGYLEIECHINGVSVDFVALVNLLVSSYDSDVERKAEELIAAKFDNLEEQLSGVRQTLEDASEEMKRKFWSNQE